MTKLSADMPPHQLPIEIYTFWRNVSNVSFRKKSSVFSDPADHKTILTLSPTNHYRGPYSRIEDYELKVSITLRSPTGVPRRKGGALLLPLLVSDI